MSPARAPLHHPARPVALALSWASGIGTVLVLAGWVVHVRGLTAVGVVVLAGCVVFTRAWYLRRGRRG